MSKVELKSCPFCGGEAKLIERTKVFEYDRNDFAVIHCKECGASMFRRFSWFDDVDECIKAWNNRVANIQAEKHGEWLRSPGWEFYSYCSECGNIPLGHTLPRFCPKCGARMDGKK